ncbi:MAG: hypothetical protein AB7S78_12010 [Candidatus Omnitrophota bacterium]
MDKKRKYFVNICILLGVALICSGCQPLKKKFTRKKKEEKEEKFIPILEPVDYGESNVSQQQRYNHHYLIYRVWEKEFVAGLERDDSDKRLKYALEQVIINLEEMGNLIPLDKKKTLNETLEHYRVSLNFLEKSKALRNYDSYISQLRRFERDVRRNLKPDIVFAVNEE